MYAILCKLPIVLVDHHMLKEQSAFFGSEEVLWDDVEGEIVDGYDGKSNRGDCFAWERSSIQRIGFQISSVALSICPPKVEINYIL